MAQTTTLSVRHGRWDDPPTLTSWTIQEEPSSRISWTPHAQARPKRPRKPECREVLTSDNSLECFPSIHIHGCACRCTDTQTENQIHDALLAAKIAALTKTLLLTTTTTTTTTMNHPTKKTSILSTLTRLFSPPPSPPSLPLQADLCIGCADLDIDKVARYLLPLPPPPPPAVGHDINDDGSQSRRRAPRPPPPPLPVNLPNHLGMTPLMAAVRSPAAGVARPRAQLEMVRFLVEGCGADVEAVRVDRVTGQGESVLSMACVAGAVEVVRYLVGKGVVVDRRLPFGAGMGKGVVVGRGQTALHVAVLAGRAESVEVLVGEGKADVNAVFDAADSEDAAVERGVKGLRGRARSVSRGGREKRPRHPVSPLHLAHGSYACSRVLLECGANVDAKDGYGRTPLRWAAEAGHADVVRLLMSAGAGVSVVANNGITPLEAVRILTEDGDGKQGHDEVVRVLLLNKGSNSGVRGQGDGETDGTVQEKWLSFGKSCSVFIETVEIRPGTIIKEQRST
ncbi:Serine/threonine-protein phosphatase 6 regulatory ankyrin repeat subunit C [Chaetomidium leptoderma]|uniref:Serine/threonine-protein phosphatase 6 regulatory ankyrin repeat subunit C n=1 Tax=Chaetomidium leptoderma TaxID=669021 RepID=A0AAN6ZYR3_9PEZI|nr:Serine/threonine-protein phosphatase 6 regulatory ankyrin repeat subunit C [Chaetomidium leptoderma]